MKVSSITELHVPEILQVQVSTATEMTTPPTDHQVFLVSRILYPLTWTYLYMRLALLCVTRSCHWIGLVLQTKTKTKIVFLLHAIKMYQAFMCKGGNLGQEL